MTPTELLLIDQCLRADRGAQEMLYRKFYGQMMGVCLRYVDNREEAREVLNDGFLKVFKELKNYSRQNPLGAWIRKIMVHTAIDHYRRGARRQKSIDIIYAETEETDHDIFAFMSAEEILLHVQQLTPAYRIVFNMFAIEGYTHAEIAQYLDISEGTSKSNYFKARAHLRKSIIESAPPTRTVSYGR